jgi:arsenite transporter
MFWKRAMRALQDHLNKWLLLNVGLAMLGIIFLIFFGKATMIMSRWQVVALLLVPSGLYVVLSLALQTWLNRRLGLPYGDHMAAAFASSSSNNAAAIAIATMAFAPLVAVPAATMPIIQSLLMVTYMKMAPRVCDYFDAVCNRAQYVRSHFWTRSASSGELDH